MNSVIVPGPPFPLPTNVPIPPPPPDFNGQWTGQVFGDAPGLAVLELEWEGGLITGTAYLYPDDVTATPVAIRLSYNPTSGPQCWGLPVHAFDPDLGRPMTAHEMATKYPGAVVPPAANVFLTFNHPHVFVSYETAISKGSGTLLRAHSAPSGVRPIPQTWGQFRDHIFQWSGKDNFVFRGQSDIWPLRTSFHRSTRKNLDRYSAISIREAHKALVNRIGEKLDLNNPEDLGSFYSLLQHHGYPTPLLDWTASPFVAAYFAFEEHKADLTKPVRIFAFDRTAWQRLIQSNQLTLTRPHMSFVDILPRGNSRAEPQKSVLTLTNVDDIEAHIVATEKRHNEQFLWVIDIPGSERAQALRDLEGMGLDRSRLFPDLDGACRSLRAKHFGAY